MAGKPAAKQARTAPTRRPATKPRKPSAAASNAPTPPFIRGGRLSVPEDEPAGDLEFEELALVNNPRQRAFLMALVHTPRISSACRAAGISVVAAWKWRHNEGDIPFQNALRVAIELGLERAESEGWRRAVDGYEKPIYHQGRLVGTERVFSDGLLMSMLKAHKREKYGDKQEVSGPHGGPIQTQVFDADALTDTQIAERIALLQRSLAEPLKQMVSAVDARVDAKLSELDAAKAAYAKELAERNGGNGNGNG